jgi:hypothetical protein
MDIKRLVEVAVEIYDTNFFPEMEVNWRSYPDNIGHKLFPGCFRCHEGQHIDDRGTTISHECSICHEFLPPRGAEEPTSLVQTAGFFHPVPLEGSHATLRCNRCHTGGAAPSRSCEGCHTMQHEFRAGTLGAFASFGVPSDPMAETVGCDGCHDLSEPTDIETIDGACMDCHEDEEERFEGMLEAWSREVDQLLGDAEVRDDDRVRRLLQTLRTAGPLHNIEATRIIVRSLTSGPVTERTRPPRSEREPR